eukprot:gene23234-30116_t
MPSREAEDFDNAIDFIYLACAIGCVICAALAAGMTMGLLSLDSLKLRVKLLVGTESEKIAAKRHDNELFVFQSHNHSINVTNLRILPLIENHHFLLCTLLLFNALANEALPIFLDAVLPAWAAVLISVTLVLLCGEILPTAIFTGPDQLVIASRCTGLVYFLEIIFYPIARPMALLLDRFLGSDCDDDYMRRDEISAMLRIISDGQPSLRHNSRERIKSSEVRFSSLKSSDVEEEEQIEEGARASDAPSFSEEAPLSADEVTVVTGVLALAKKTIQDVFTPLDQVDMLCEDNLLDRQTLAAIDRVGHSRLPVFRGENRTNIMGFLLVKKLVGLLAGADGSLVRVGDISLNQPLILGTKQSLLDVLALFQRGQSHLALVSDQPIELQTHYSSSDDPPPSRCAPLGIVTLEDILEEMLQSEILDEGDLAQPDENSNREASAALRDLSYSVSSSSARIELLPSQLESPLPQRAIRPNLNIGGVLRLLLADRSPDSIPERQEKSKEENKKAKNSTSTNCEILKTSSSPEINSPAVNWAPTQN